MFTGLVRQTKAHPYITFAATAATIVVIVFIILIIRKKSGLQWAASPSWMPTGNPNQSRGAGVQRATTTSAGMIGWEGGLPGDRRIHTGITPENYSRMMDARYTREGLMGGIMSPGMATSVCGQRYSGEAIGEAQMLHGIGALTSQRSDPEHSRMYEAIDNPHREDLGHGVYA